MRQRTIMIITSIMMRDTKCHCGCYSVINKNDTLPHTFLKWFQRTTEIHWPSTHITDFERPRRLDDDDDENLKEREGLHSDVFPTSESEEMNIIWKGQSGWNKKSNMKRWDDLGKEPKKQYLNCGDDLPEILSKTFNLTLLFLNSVAFIVFIAFVAFCLHCLHRLRCFSSHYESPFSVWQSLFKALICIHRYKVDGVWNTSIFFTSSSSSEGTTVWIDKCVITLWHAQESNARMVNFLRGISPHFKSQPSRASSSSGSMWWRLKCVVKQHMLLTSRSKSPPNIPSTMLDKEVSIGNFRLMSSITPITKMLWTQMWNINHISQPNNQINSSENQWLPKQSINEHNHFPRDRLGVPDGLMMTTVWGNVKVSSLMSSQPQQCESVKTTEMKHRANLPWNTQKWKSITHAFMPAFQNENHWHLHWVNMKSMRVYTYILCAYPVLIHQIEVHQRVFT